MEEHQYNYSVDGDSHSSTNDTVKGRWRKSESSDDNAEWNTLHSLWDETASLGGKRVRQLHSASDQVVPLHVRSTRSCGDHSKSKELIGKWKMAAKKCSHLAQLDPWQQFNINELPIRSCIRHRYSSIRKQWTEDRVQVKMHPESFARGAMRECYRLKKLSSFHKKDNWSNAQNYVAKKYIQQVDRQVIFDDVKLQMDSKLWAEEFNRHNPPKKIDIVQMCVLEFDEPGHPLYHLEHYIEGEYVKYNSNSGFVSDICRRTPQAFSHFTFERSGHQLIVVDVQGVGDLYTDPQVHTALGTDYGDGNLGTKGMALFFHSHVCNEICHSMCLTEFDLSASELRALNEGTNSEKNVDPSTAFVNCDLLDICSPLTADEDDNAMERLRQRTFSMNSSARRSSLSSYGGSLAGDMGTEAHSERCLCDDCLDQEDLRMIGECALRARGRASESASAVTDGTEDEDTERDAFWIEARKMSRPAGFLSEAEMLQLAELARQTHTSSILGQIHLDLARYHELGRFVNNPTSASSNKENQMFVEEGSDGVSATSFSYDKEAALYHIDVARRCGILEAIITVAEMAYGLPHELLKDAGDDEHWGCDDREEFGFELMETAAEMGDRPAMLFVAESYENGRHMGKHGTPSWPKSIDWYHRAANFMEDSEDEMDETIVRPRYEIIQKIAEMYKDGGCGLQQDFCRAYELFTEAAEAAMEAMKGKLANKLYELAEQCAM